jgi:hypothetical protein
MIKIFKDNKAEATQHQINTLAFVQKAFEAGEDRGAIKLVAASLVHTPLLFDVITLFRDKYPISKACGCGRIMRATINPFTLRESLFCAECDEAAEKTQRQAERQAVLSAFLNNADEILLGGGAPRLFLKARITDFSERAAKLADVSGGLFLTGGRGNGKTRLAVALMREHLKKVKVTEVCGTTPIIPKTSLPIFVAVPELLLSLRESYSRNDTSEGEIISKYTEGSLLVLDDLGAEKSTEWSINILYIIIDRRYRDEKKTIITSNLSLDELADKLDDRIASRIAGMCTVVPMGGADRRLIK